MIQMQLNIGLHRKETFRVPITCESLYCACTENKSDEKVVLIGRPFLLLFYFPSSSNGVFVSILPSLR